MLLAIIAVIAVIGLVFFMSQKSPRQESSIQPTNPPAATATESPAAMKENTIAVEGGMFYFKPNEIRVKKGEKVKIVFTNKEGMHDFVIDELNVRSDRIQAGTSTQIEFTPDKIGSFEFYCSVGNHRQMGMKGTLIVE